MDILRYRLVLVGRIDHRDLYEFLIACQATRGKEPLCQDWPQESMNISERHIDRAVGVSLAAVLSNRSMGYDDLSRA